jgi:hypothetical protein
VFKWLHDFGHYRLAVDFLSPDTPFGSNPPISTYSAPHHRVPTDEEFRSNFLQATVFISDGLPPALATYARPGLLLSPECCLACRLGTVCLAWHSILTGTECSVPIWSLYLGSNSFTLDLKMANADVDQVTHLSTTAVLSGHN